MRAYLFFYHCEICKRLIWNRKHETGLHNQWICPRCYRAYVRGADDHAEYNEFMNLRNEIRRLTTMVNYLQGAIERMGKEGKE